MGDGDGSVNLDDVLVTMRETGAAMKTCAFFSHGPSLMALQALQGDIFGGAGNQRWRRGVLIFMILACVYFYRTLTGIFGRSYSSEKPTQRIR